VGAVQACGPGDKALAAIGLSLQKDCSITALRAAGASGLTMESIGSQLRKARLARGLSLEQISSRTRISTRILAELEDDATSSAASPFFYKSYIRQFAEQVNLNYDLVAEAVQERSAGLPAPQMPGEHDFERIRVAQKVQRKRRGWAMPASVLAFGTMLVGFSVIYAVWEQRFGPQNAARTAAGRTAVQAPKPNPAPSTQAAEPKKAITAAADLVDASLASESKTFVSNPNLVQ